EVDYPDNLTKLYQNWQRTYFSFYQSEEMRGRAVGGGIVAPTLDFHAELVKAESRFMYEFHRWLKDAELYDIRDEIIRAFSETNQPIRLFLTCATLDLERLPWEAWEIGKAVQVIRAPVNVVAPSVNQKQVQRQGRPRILAILGDDTGLDFQEDKEAVKSLLRIAEVQFVGWQPEQTCTQVIQKIRDAIADERGWDVLFFAGHSNETDMTGGELGIAPGVSISIQEIAPQLSAAKERGLQVAIFNSCSGINIAQSLIDLGFSQVMVMREPIHNRVAQEFLVQFLQGLGKHQDVYESAVAARQFLQLEKSHTYPSAYLVPSLFCHPGAELYRIPQFKWKQRLRQSLPNFVEAIALTTSVILSTIIPVQDSLLDGRMFTQAVYRDATAQSLSSEAPPVALVQIDAESVLRARFPDSQVRPMNRTYIAKLLDRLRKLNASVVGIDFIFDTPQLDPPQADEDLGEAVREAVDANMWLVFGAVLRPNREVGTNEAFGITDWDWTLQAYLDAYAQFVEIPNPERDCRNACPFSYLISLLHAANQEITDLPQPNTQRNKNLRAEFLDLVNKHQNKGKLLSILNWRSPLGLQPVVDFSIPAQQIYTKIPAWKLIENADINEFPLLPQQVVLIAVSSDDRFGVAAGQPDRFPTPSAIYYRTQQDWFTGGESLAYMTHHFLTRRMVIPIPDIWMIVLAVIFGKITTYLIKEKLKFNQKQTLYASTGALIVYGAAVLQIYISAAILIPLLLPSVVFLAFVLPKNRKKNHAQF
ncbi:MAG: CHASE2 domain-containing protein, partial [Cyanobacteria bacterium J06632_19]